MAVTYAITNLVRDFTMARRFNSGTATATGTYSAGGDSITAAALGLAVIDSFDVGPAVEGTPLKFDVRPVIAANKQSVAIQLFGTNAGPGPAVPDPQVT